MDNIITKLKEADIKPNKYRKEILYFLEEYKTHPTAHDIFDYMKKKFPYVSLATVYNTLNVFLENNLVIALQSEGNTVHYDATTDGHAHFICEKCGTIIDIKGEENKGKRKIKNNVINRVVTYYFGVCAACNQG